MSSLVEGVCSSSIGGGSSVSCLSGCYGGPGASSAAVPFLPEEAGCVHGIYNISWGAGPGPFTQ